MEFLKYAVAVILVIMSLKPLRASAAYRFGKTQLNLVGLGFIALAVWVGLTGSYWPIVLGAGLFYLSSRLDYD